ncbi:MAG TPA: hypothetical protein PLF79_02310 [Thauera sp.]|uniref:hypothetical protein n=1 Tax=Thauera sp. TaxID=1905334 RepID=UPI002D041A62|nr:hypothetical protein [Thauera sp.]HRP23687.1 hypothetical protein [Thauera sp.]HRP64873.1 hypothetical protein [Thauera sp.]
MITRQTIAAILTTTALAWSVSPAVAASLSVKPVHETASNCSTDKNAAPDIVTPKKPAST